MIPSKDKWHSMDTAPKDGTVFMALHKAWNQRDGKDQVQACQYFCNEFGEDWRWRSPYRTGTIAHADAWMTLAEFAAHQDTPAPTAAPEPAPIEEFDL